MNITPITMFSVAISIVNRDCRPTYTWGHIKDGTILTTPIDGVILTYKSKNCT